MADPNTPKALRWAGLLLGLSLGGFFDGILLHQVLQWHHLLSNVDAARDLRVQLLADGLFHALMYLLAAWALWLLWKARAEFAQPGADRRLWALALVGFGSWHVLDALLSHWITGIHRIRVDSAQPLFWDVLWLAVFGIVPLVIGWRVGRKGGGGTPRHAGATLALAAIVAGPIAAWPAGDATEALVLFPPGTSGAAAFNALARADARVLWADRSGGLWAVKVQEPGLAGRLYREGAWLVSGPVVGVGCFGWTRTRPA